jgi:hypothetical protein
MATAIEELETIIEKIEKIRLQVRQKRHKILTQIILRNGTENEGWTEEEEEKIIIFCKITDTLFKCGSELEKIADDEIESEDEGIEEGEEEIV